MNMNEAQALFWIITIIVGITYLFFPYSKGIILMAFRDPDKSNRIVRLLILIIVIYFYLNLLATAYPEFIISELVEKINKILKISHTINLVYPLL